MPPSSKGAGRTESGVAGRGPRSGSGKCVMAGRGPIAYQFDVGALIDRRLAALGTTLDACAPVYEHAARVNAKSFIMLMVLPFAAVAWAVFARSRRPAATHVVFALPILSVDRRALDQS